MTGKALALTTRDRTLLAEVQRHSALTRDHLIRLKLFASKTRVNERLKRLTRAGYLSARRQPLLSGGPRFVYFPGRLLTEAHARARSQQAWSDLFLNHHLGIVDIRLAFEAHSTVTRWLSEHDLAGLAVGLIPDAYVEFRQDGLTYCAFIEYDRGTETLGRLERKVRSYLELAFSGRFERTFGRRFFRALLITDSVGRVATMTDAVAHVTDRVVRLTTRAQIVDHGPLAVIWRRPGQSSLESLTPS
ncbi:MAG TPA: replication-relaxation family protein [Vicinamibacterales bacterium]|nr:replication-relaxation family protein [Vicinamibacterales bacterium]